MYTIKLSFACHVPNFGWVLYFPLKGNRYTFRGNTVKILKKGYIPLGANISIFFLVDPFQKGFCARESKQQVTEVFSIVSSSFLEDFIDASLKCSSQDLDVTLSQLFSELLICLLTMKLMILKTEKTSLKGMVFELHCRKPGPIWSKLTMSLVNLLLKF